MSGNTRKKLKKQSEQEKKNKRKGLVKGGILLGLAAMMGISGTMAYLTDFRIVRNRFLLGDVKIKLEEPSFDSTKPMESIVPSQVIPKDPMIRNIGENEAYVFMEVLVPYYNLVTAEEDGTVAFEKGDEAFQIQPLFTYDYNEEDWVFINERDETYDNGKTECGYKVFYYGYKKPVQPGEATSTLFDSVTVANYAFIENVDRTKEIMLSVQGRAIQTENTGGTAEDDEGRMRHAFTIYYKENPETQY